jgi:alpha-galactosidase
MALSDNTVRWFPGGMLVELQVDAGGPVRIRSLGLADHPVPVRPGASDGSDDRWVPLVEIDLIGEGRLAISTAAQHRPYLVSRALRYAGHEELPTGNSTTLLVRQRDEDRGIEVATQLRHYAGADALRVVSEVTNVGPEPVTLTYLSSLSLTGFGSGLDVLRLHEARNVWLSELRWRALTAEEAGIVYVGDFHYDNWTSKGRHAVTTVGSRSSGDFLPVGAVENVAEEVAWAWQVEHHGGWHWELGDLHGDLYLQVSGPTDREHQWRQRLTPGERFTTVPVAVAVARDGLTGGLRALTDYRRLMRRRTRDNELLPVIFNDFMKCLNGDPNEEKVAPLIEAAAEVGADYYVMDAGWFAEEKDWWDTVGEWQESPTRFPSGLSKTMERIREHGLTPGLWLEPEVIGVRSPVADQLPADAFFTYRGGRVREADRYQLDYRCPQVRHRMDAVADRIIHDYGLGYLKLDYNIDVGPGTDSRQESPGAGLLEHHRAYADWLDGVLARHPGLVVEQCASGGMRMDYGMMSRADLVSTSDQQDPGRYAPIAASAPTAVAPEQSGSWASPQPEHSPEQLSFTLVNSMMGRMHLAGRIDLLSADQRARVRAAVDAYRGYRLTLAGGRPQWPVGLPGWHDPWVALAVDSDDDCVVAVWYRGAGEGEIVLPLARLGAGVWRAEAVFPTDLPMRLEWSDPDRRLRVGLPGGPVARIIRLRRVAD